MKYAKHIHVLNLLTGIPECVDGISPLSTEEANEAFDNIFTYIHANWAEPLSMGEYGKMTNDAQIAEVIGCGKMLMMARGDVIDKLETLPPYFHEALFPVAVALWLIRYLSIPMYHKDTKTFGEFHRRYGAMILNYRYKDGE